MENGECKLRTLIGARTVRASGKPRLYWSVISTLKLYPARAKGAGAAACSIASTSFTNPR
jgi:hypothetical protein